jgi:hypothetical protein
MAVDIMAAATRAADSMAEVASTVAVDSTEVEDFTVAVSMVVADPMAERGADGLQ